MHQQVNFVTKFYKLKYNKVKWIPVYPQADGILEIWSQMYLYIDKDKKASSDNS